MDNIDTNKGSNTTTSNNTSKQQQKELDEQEAKRRNITYKEVRQERRQREKESTSNSKRSKKEVDQLASSEHDREIKRMRTYSHDENNNTTTTTTTTTTSRTGSNATSNTNQTQLQPRPRTRSIDIQQVQKDDITNTSSLSIKEWQQLHSITIQQHHDHHNHHSSGNTSTSSNIQLPNPYRTFQETPFDSKILHLFTVAKFIAPTPIQSQSWPIAIQQYDMICIAKTGSGSYVYIIYSTISCTFVFFKKIFIVHSFSFHSHKTSILDIYL
jgi:hypothetical protein